MFDYGEESLKMSDNGKKSGKEEGIDKKQENEKRISKKEFNREIQNAVQQAMEDVNKNFALMIKTAINKAKEEHKLEIATMKAEFQGQVNLLKTLVTEKEGKINKLNREIGELKSSV